MNHPPQFPETSTTRSVDENSEAGARVGEPVTADDADMDTLAYTLSASDSFTVDGDSGQILVKQGASLDFEEGTSSFVTVTATDPSTDTDSSFVTITLNDVNEAPEADNDDDSTSEDTAVTIDVVANDNDPDAGDPNDTLSVSVTTPPANGVAQVDAASDRITYTPDEHYHGTETFTYEVTDTGGLSDEATVVVTVHPVNDPPEFPAATTRRSVAPSAVPGTAVGAPVTATDVDDEVLTYRLAGPGASMFGIDETQDRSGYCPAPCWRSRQPTQ